MKPVFHFILSHSIFIAFCAAAFSLQTLQLLLLPVNGYLLSLIFFAALAGYNAYWILSSYSYSRPIAFIPFLQKRSSSILVLLVAASGVVFCFTRLHLFMYNFIVASILLAFYSLPVMPVKKLQSLLKAGVSKTIILALAWTIITTMVPLQISILSMGRVATLIFISRFLFMLMLCIIFDKRDAAVDKLRGLQSLATQIAPLVLHYLIVFLFIGYTFLCYSMYVCGVSLAQVSALIMAALLALLVYFISLKKQGYIFYYFLVDGLMFLSALLTGFVS
jgi:4-hydroxybenzoate polyprenyltransferase